jgi:hypothetical protein
MSATFQKNLGAVDDFQRKRVSGACEILKLVGPEMLDVDGPANFFLDGHHPSKGFAIASIRNDQHIDVAMRGRDPFGYRSENKRHVDRQSLKRGSDNVGDAKGFPREAAQFVENGALAIGLELLEIASCHPGKNPGVDECAHLSLNRRGINLGDPGEFP